MDARALRSSFCDPLSLEQMLAHKSIEDRAHEHETPEPSRHTLLSPELPRVGHRRLVRSYRLEADLLLDIIQDSLYPSVPDPVGRVEHDFFHRFNDLPAHSGLELNEVAALSGTYGLPGALATTSNRRSRGAATSTF